MAIQASFTYASRCFKPVSRSSRASLLGPKRDFPEVPSTQILLRRPNHFNSSTVPIAAKLQWWRGSDQLSPLCNTSHADGRVLQRPGGVARCSCYQQQHGFSWASHDVTTRPLKCLSGNKQPKAGKGIRNPPLAG